jgi:signal peptidase I
MDLYIYIMPIVPDLGDYLNSMLGIGLPFLIYLYASRTINEYNNGVERNYGTETFKLIDIPFIAFMVVLICLISGFIPYYMIGIGSESMTNAINKGDLVIIDKKYKKLSEGDILAFNESNKIIVHRITQVIDDKAGLYKTKGDKNNAEDSWIVEKENIVGKVKLRIRLIGWPTVALSELISK